MHQVVRVSFTLNATVFVAEYYKAVDDEDDESMPSEHHSCVICNVFVFVSFQRLRTQL